MRCAAIISADPTTRAEGLRLAMLAMADAGAAVVRVGNPQRMALTAGRILLQIDPEQLESEPGGAMIAAVLARRKGPAEQLVLVIEQAETLAADGLRAVQRCAAEPFVRVVFVGAPGFRQLLTAGEFAPLRAALAPVVPGSPRRRMPPVGWWAGALAGCVAVAVLVLYSRPRATDVVAVAPAVLEARTAVQPAPEPVPEPAPKQAQVPEPRPEPVPAPAGGVAPPVEPAAPPLPTPPLPPQAPPRQALPLPPAVPAGFEGRVVIHYRRGSVAGEALAGRLAQVAGPIATTVQVRETAATPSAPQVRFFHAEDAARAAQVAAQLPEPGAAWDVRDFTGFRPSPSPGSIEVWLP